MTATGPIQITSQPLQWHVRYCRVACPAIGIAACAIGGLNLYNGHGWITLIDVCVAAVQFELSWKYWTWFRI